MVVVVVVVLFVFPYGALCGLFWWDCALCEYRIAYLGQYVSCERSGR